MRQSEVEAKTDLIEEGREHTLAKFVNIYFKCMSIYLTVIACNSNIRFPRKCDIIYSEILQGARMMYSTTP